MSGTLDRRLGTGDAVFIGLGSMIGAGIFAAFAPAAAAAGGGLLVGLALAAVVAFCNATSSAQLAAQYPTSGGTYVYGREQLGPWWGFLAGWSFVIGKTASCAAMALTFAAYAAPAGWEKPVAVAAVVGLVAVNYRGVARTAALTRVIVVVVLLVLALVAASGIAGVGAASGAFGGLGGGAADGALGSAAGGEWMPGGGLLDAGWYGILQSAGLLFFAFAGYARIATLGEEVRNPARSIPRAITLALGIAVLVYAVVAITALGALGPAALASSTEPLVDTVTAAGWSWSAPVVRFGAAAASLGALLALIAGIGRTTLAMARAGDLPRFLSAVHPTYRVPHRAEVVLAVVVCLLVLTVDLRSAIAFSSFGVLLYYLVANASALRQARSERRYPRALQVLGAIGCLGLVATLPPTGIVVGVAVLAVGVVGRMLVLWRRRRPRRPSPPPAS